MRRLPIYFLIDVSESMVGEPIIQVEKGMRNIIQELRTDPYALETVFVSVIVFAGKEKVLSPLTELYKFYPPQFPIGGGTSLGTALDCLMNDIDKSVKKTTVEMTIHSKPSTDGTHIIREKRIWFVFQSVTILILKCLEKSQTMC